jgi:membrane protease YdiL (CAAX protease family)
MANAITEARKSDPITPIASPLHLVLVLGLTTLWALRSAINPDHIAQAASLDRVRFYLRTIAFEWVMLGVVLLGVRFHGASMYTVLGERWRSSRDMLRDIGIAAGFWLISTIILSAVSLHPHDSQPSAVVKAILPNGWLESTLWIALSISAGICEEAIYRGYIQRQLISITSSAPAGIVLTALAFGLAHSYKSWPGAVQVALGGLMLGTLAYWTKSVRPGMMAHAFSDAFAGVLARALKIGVA